MTEINIIFLLFVAFGIKHFIIDFLWQTPYEWQNKGKYGHFGGILHSGKHFLSTIILLIASFLFFGSPLIPFYPIILFVSFVEFIVHYHTDWIKVNINEKMGWGSTTHPQFWYMVGLDQFIHFLNYVWIIWMII